MNTTRGTDSDTPRTATTPHPRRAVLSTAAWAAPSLLVAGAAPALAASPCTNQERIALGWKRAKATGASSSGADFTNALTFNLTAADRLESKGAVTGTPAPVTLTVTHHNEGVVRGIAGNGQIIDEGGPAANPDIFYDIRQKTGVNGPVKPDPAKDYQLVTFRFSTPLRGLIFSIARIDQSANRLGGPDVIDAVSLASKVAYTSKPARIPGDSNPSIVTGAGSVSNPWQSKTLDTEPITLRGQIDIFFSETEYVQEFTLRVANLSTNRSPRSNDQRIAVRGFLGWRDLC